MPKTKRTSVYVDEATRLRIVEAAQKRNVSQVELIRIMLDMLEDSEFSNSIDEWVQKNKE